MTSLTGLDDLYLAAVARRAHRRHGVHAGVVEGVEEGGAVTRRLAAAEVLVALHNTQWTLKTTTQLVNYTGF